MSLKDTVTSIETHLTEAYNTLEEKGATLPENKNLENLSAAIESVSGGGDSEFGEATVELWVSGNSTQKSKLVGFTQVQLSGMVSALAVPSKAQFDCGSVALSSTSTPKSYLIKARLVGNIVSRDYILGSINTTNSFSGLKEIILEETTTIASYFGATSSSLNKVSLPDTLATIGTYFLWDCASLKYLTLPDSLSSVGTQFMGECKLLQGLYIPANVTPPTDNYSLSTTNAGSPSYVNGITLYGPGAQAWINALPNRTTSPYRKLIYGGGGEPEPDEALTLTNLKSTLDTGNAEETFPIGTEITDTWNNEDIKWTVMDYGTATLANGTTKQGVYLTCLTPNLTSVAGNAVYGSSTINTYLNSTFLDSCSADLKNMISEIKVPYYDGSSDTTTDAKIWVPGINEIMGSDSNIGNGSNFDLWKQRTGLTTGNGSANTGRILKTASGTAVDWWLRDYSSSAGLYCVNTSGAVKGAGSVMLNYYLIPCVFIAKN